MLVAIDIGNTNIKIGFFKKEILSQVYRFCTATCSSLEKTKKALQGIGVKIRESNNLNVIICSVVPHATHILKSYFTQNYHLEPLILGENVKVPIKNFYRHPNQLGQDRLVNAFSAFYKFRTQALVIDFGTAITFDLISRKGEYLGGIIVPGIETSLHALSQKAALLPLIKLIKPRNLIGRETKESMVSGIVFGFSTLVEGLIEKIKEKWRENFLVIATGGSANFIATYCPSIDKVEKNLTLEGLKIIFLKNLENMRKNAKKCKK